LKRTGNKFMYRCVDCVKEYSNESTMYLCPSCSTGNTSAAPPKGVLKTMYDYNSLIKKGDFSYHKKNHFI